jgi:transcriptional regulator with XRE-family HTH domain
MVSSAQRPLLLAFGRAVRTLRAARGLSQEALADEAHLHRTYVGSIERGERNVSLLNLDRLAQALDVDLATLMRETDRRRASGDASAD